jgi:ribosomal protein S11
MARKKGAKKKVKRTVTKGIVHIQSTFNNTIVTVCLLYTSPSPRDRQKSRMPSSA